MNQQLITILAVGLILAVIIFSAFVQGLRLGMKTARGEIPKGIQNPVKTAIKAYENHVEAKKREELEKEMTDFMQVDYGTLLKEVKSGR